MMDWKGQPAEGKGRKSCLGAYVMLIIVMFSETAESIPGTGVLYGGCLLCCS